ncbi:MAG: glycerol-3-phosphate 1-O-acyltransferase PlsY [Lentisphaeria bacterium]
MIENLVILLLTYLLGSIPFGFIIGKVNGVDIRQVGSGNIGATNVLRTFGKKWGIFCFFLDFMKGLLPVILVKILCKDNDYAPLLAVAGTVLGHVFTCFLGFKGGKGVATTAGALFGIATLPVFIGLVIWFITLKLTGYVSLGSIIAGIVLPFIIWFDPFKANYGLPTKYLFIVMAFIVILRHRSNVQRLLRGEENKFGKKKGK